MQVRSLSRLLFDSQQVALSRFRKQFSTFSSPACDSLATLRERLLHRILQRFLKVTIGNLQVVFRCHCARVAHPRTDNVRREGLFQFRLPSAAKILKDLGPRLQPCPSNDPHQLRSQVGICIAIAGDHKLFPGCSGIKGSFQVQP